MLFNWYSLGALGAYMVLMFVAHMIDNAARRQTCLLVRLCNICKNQAREAKLHQQLKVTTVSFAIDELHPLVRNTYLALDSDRSGSISELQMEDLGLVLAERVRNGAQVQQRDVKQVKDLLLEIFNTNVDGVVAPSTCDSVLQSECTSVYEECAD